MKSVIGSRNSSTVFTLSNVRHLVSVAGRVRIISKGCWAHRHSQAGSLVKMRQANCFYLAALIAILCVNFSQQEQLQEDKESEESSEIQNDSPLWPYFYYGSNSDQEVINFKPSPSPCCTLGVNLLKNKKWIF